MLCQECLNNFEDKDLYWCESKDGSHQYLLCKSCLEIIKPKKYKLVKTKKKRTYKKKPKLTRRSMMPYGKYKNKKMMEVPTNYLLWLYNNKKCSKQVKEYVEKRMPQK